MLKISCVIRLKAGMCFTNDEFTVDANVDFDAWCHGKARGDLNAVSVLQIALKTEFHSM